MIATSSGAAAAYVKEGFTNIRIGMFLEMATTAGALVGAASVTHVSASVVAVIFGVMLMLSAIVSRRHSGNDRQPRSPAALAAVAEARRKLPRPEGPVRYQVARRPGGFRPDVRGRRAFRAAGHRLRRAQSPGHGPGDGHPLQSLHHHQQLHDRRHRGRQRRAVSEFRGYIDPGLAMPVMLGVLPGAMFGAWLLPKAPADSLRKVFAAVIFALAIEMLYNGAKGRL